MGKISYERLVYESVDEKSRSLAMSQKTTTKMGKLRLISLIMKVNATEKHSVFFYFVDLKV